MTMTSPSHVDRPAERGAALIGVLLLLMMMSALAAAVGVSGRTETLVARNHQSAAQAKAAAEAGLNHAVQVVIADIREWQPNGFANVDAALDGLLAAAGSLEAVEGWGVPIGTRIPIAGASAGVEYEAVIMDEDDPARGADATQIDGDGDATNNEDNNPLNDANRKLIIRASGFAQDGTSVVLEAVIAPIPLPAVVTNSDLDISGNPTITGTNGSVHSNGDLTIGGNSAAVTGNASTSGELTCNDPCDQVQGTATEGATPVPIPTVRASDYRFWADYILTDAGTVTDPSGAVLCTAGNNGNGCRNTYGWSFDGPAGWSVGATGTPLDGTYYVEGGATISGSPGTSSDPIQISIIAEGSIDISGNPDLVPDTPELLFVTDGDLEISGGVASPLTIQGQMLVHEQLKISGNPTLSGQFIVEDAANVSTLVTSNQISGNPTIVYNGSLGTGLFSVVAWRDVR